ncbi:MAG TPA: tRNA pseudouridine(55) synthase, partial [Bacteroidales bacterium]|nr:tRNA pseudouridine(55) synthase [Bacteroidales bacterium]
DSFQDLDKVYIGSMFVGATTPSYDKETEVDSTFDINNISKSQLLETATQFLGETEQVPPIFSAVKIEGKRAFEYARKNNEVKLNSRKITIRKFELLSFDLPEINFIVECSKGTYIRSLVNDFGKALNNGAYMSSLRRTAIGNYTVSDALSVKEIKNAIVSYRE